MYDTSEVSQTMKSVLDTISHFFMCTYSFESSSNHA